MSSKALPETAEVDDSPTPTRKGTFTVSAVSKDVWLDREYCTHDDCDEPITSAISTLGDDDPLCYVHLALEYGDDDVIPDIAGRDEE